MTSKERMLIALGRRQPDTVPVFLRDITLGMDIAGLSTPDVCTGGPDGGYDARKSADCIVACWERFKQDCVIGSVQDLAMDVEALGGRSEFPERGVPCVSAYPFEEKERFRTARVPRMDTEGRLPGVLRAYELVKERLGAEVAIAANLEGPVTKAGILRGMERLMIDLVDDPAFAADLVSFATDVTLSHMAYLAQAGVDFVFVAAASDGPAVISPEIYLSLTIPNLKRIAEAAAERGLEVVFHPHGRFTDEMFHSLVDAAIETGIVGFQFAEQCDLAVAKRLWGERIAVMGGVDVPTVLVPGPPEVIRAEVQRCIRQAGEGGGYVFMPSCSLHRGAPLEYIQAMVLAVREFGGYRHP